MRERFSELILADVGRINKTLSLLDFMTGGGQHLRILIKLNHAQRPHTVIG